MRRLLLVLLAALLVNVPWAHDAWTNHRLSADGTVVSATLVKHRTVGGRHLVLFKLPRRVDASRTAYEARIDTGAYRTAVASGRVRVRVLPGHPGENRAVGEVPSHFFVGLAVLGDAILLLIAFALLARRRRWRPEVVEVDEPWVRFSMGGRTWIARMVDTLPGLAVGRRLPGRLALRAESDVMATTSPALSEHVVEARYVVRGRIADVSRTQAVLVLDDGYRMHVDLRVDAQTTLRNRADLRERAEVTGVLEARWVL